MRVSREVVAAATAEGAGWRRRWQQPRRRRGAGWRRRLQLRRQCRVNRVEEGSRVEKEAAAAAVGARGCWGGGASSRSCRGGGGFGFSWNIQIVVQESIFQLIPGLEKKYILHSNYKEANLLTLLLLLKLFCISEQVNWGLLCKK